MDGYRPLGAPLLQICLRENTVCSFVLHKKKLQGPKSESSEEHPNDKTRTSLAARPVAEISSTNQNKA